MLRVVSRSAGKLAKAGLHQLLPLSRLGGAAVDALRQLPLPPHSQQLRHLALQRLVVAGLPVLRKKWEWEGFR